MAERVLKRMKTARVSSWNDAAKLDKHHESWEQKVDLLCSQLHLTSLSVT